MCIQVVVELISQYNELSRFLLAVGCRARQSVIRGGLHYLSCFFFLTPPFQDIPASCSRRYTSLCMIQKSRREFVVTFAIRIAQNDHCRCVCLVFVDDWP